ncbi:hypothetical protein B0T49_08150 [Chromobacterium violaceum]|nr:hypothetical protein CRN81_10210 [Chromobacterium violaceum]ATP32654.1 hypothetical protein CR207_10240 [Chromobacterium violaceum]OQS10248.1 hypothetical protein B0T38_11885 [Chromobacterium violaceum]OQS25249.1 hypothetical protein B0T41_13735 [Chromobacterium violaceum]OQS26661.1 hypothetical protein B0T37_11490 [Chromobacterium violaceum]
MMVFLCIRERVAILLQVISIIINIVAHAKIPVFIREICLQAHASGGRAAGASPGLDAVWTLDSIEPGARAVKPRCR